MKKAILGLFFAITALSASNPTEMPPSYTEVAVEEQLTRSIERVYNIGDAAGNLIAYSLKDTPMDQATQAISVTVLGQYFGAAVTTAALERLNLHQAHNTIPTLRRNEALSKHIQQDIFINKVIKPLQSAEVENASFSKNNSLQTLLYLETSFQKAHLTVLQSLPIQLPYELSVHNQHEPLNNHSRIYNALAEADDIYGLIRPNLETHIKRYKRELHPTRAEQAYDWVTDHPKAITGAVTIAGVGAWALLKK